jgi:hypothetical protein
MHSTPEGMLRAFCAACSVQRGQPVVRTLRVLHGSRWQKQRGGDSRQLWMTRVHGGCKMYDDGHGRRVAGLMSTFRGGGEVVRWGASVPAPRGNFLVWVVQNGRRAIRYPSVRHGWCCRRTCGIQTYITPRHDITV